MDLEEHKSLVNKLTEGKKLAEELAGRLRGTSAGVNEDRLINRVLASYEEALTLLTRPEPQGQGQSVMSSALDTSAPSASVCNVTPKDSSIGSLKRKSMEEDLQNLKIKMSQGRRPGEVSVSGNVDALEKVLAEFCQNLLVPTESDPQEKCQPVESSLSDPSGSSSSVFNATPSKESCSPYERRSMQDIRTVKITTSETTPDDVYTWRKYGLKEILGSKHPRAATTSMLFSGGRADLTTAMTDWTAAGEGRTSLVDDSGETAGEKLRDGNDLPLARRLYHHRRRRPPSPPPSPTTPTLASV